MTTTVRDDTRKLAERLPDDATWDDVVYEIHVRQSIKAGLKDAKSRAVLSSADVRRRLGLPA